MKIVILPIPQVTFKSVITFKNYIFLNVEYDATTKKTLLSSLYKIYFKCTNKFILRFKYL